MIALHQLIPAPRSLALSAVHSNQLHPAQFSQTTLNRLRGWDRFTKLSSLTPRRWVSQRPQPDHPSPIKSRKRYAATHLLELTVGATPVQFPTNPARQRHPRHPRLALDRRLNVRDGLFRKRLPTNDHLGKITLRVPRVQSKRCVAQLVCQRGVQIRCEKIVFKRRWYFLDHTLRLARRIFIPLFAKGGKRGIFNDRDQPSPSIQLEAVQFRGVLPENFLLVVSSERFESPWRFFPASEARTSRYGGSPTTRAGSPPRYRGDGRCRSNHR